MDDGTEARDVTVVARRPLDRWAVVDMLEVPPECGLDLDTAFARLAHPTAAATDVVLVLGGTSELHWLRRVHSALRGRPRGRVLAVLDGDVTEDEARRAGADGVVLRDGDHALPVAVDAAFDRLDEPVLVVADTSTTLV